MRISKSQYQEVVGALVCAGREDLVEKMGVTSMRGGQKHKRGDYLGSKSGTPKGKKAKEIDWSPQKGDEFRRAGKMWYRVGKDERDEFERTGKVSYRKNNGAKRKGP